MTFASPVVGVLVEAAAAGEDDERDLGIAEHGELVRLLKEAVAALAEGDLPVGRVLDALDLDLAPPRLVAGAGRCRLLLFTLYDPHSDQPEQEPDQQAVHEEALVGEAAARAVGLDEGRGNVVQGALVGTTAPPPRVAAQLSVRPGYPRRAPTAKPPAPPQLECGSRLASTQG